MIRRISIQGVKSFPKDAPASILIDHNKAVALFYGLNGAGKSAIGQVIHQNGNDINPFPNCSLETTGTGPYLYLVYNEDFVEQGFQTQDGFPGIFSIGQQDNEALKEADEKQKEDEKLELRREILIGQRHEKEREVLSALSDATEATWRVHTDHNDGPLKSCVVGYGKGKKKLFEDMVAVDLVGINALDSIDNLKIRIKDVEAIQPSEKVSVALDLSGLQEIEQSLLWASPILGSTHSSLAAIIQQLGNIDWVKEGEKYLSKEVCPFCQQKLPHDFEDELSRLIDESYKSRVAEIVGLHTRYSQKLDAFALAFQTLSVNETFVKEHPGIETYWAKLQLLLSTNLTQMHSKIRAPSDVAVIAPSQDAAKAVSDALVEINNRIGEFNERIRNRKTEGQKIRADFWKRMRYDYAGVIDVYATAKMRLDDLIAGFDSELEEIHGSLSAIRARLGVLRAHSVGTERSVEAINRRLDTLGITAFKIKKKGGDGNLYCLERPGVGIEKYKSLSEGEKTLISFFYFVELVNGSAVADNHVPQDKKIVVIDDPISSLSHNFVYDIASIISNEIVDGENKSRQVIVLSHSLFFHHELVKQIKTSCQYFRVIKRENSTVVKMGRDEIQNDYQAFWQVIRDARDGKASKSSVPNAMRCIFEQFFSFTDQQGHFKKALEKLGKEDHAFTPLARYLDRQSHADLPNLTDFGGVDIDYFLSKFRSVFVETKYPDHYATMMGEQPAPPMHDDATEAV